MNSHDVGRGRAGWPRRWRRVTARTDGGRRSTPTGSTRSSSAAELAAGIPGCPGLQVLASPYGHDGFLIETEEVGGIVAELFEQPAPGARARCSATAH